MANAGQFVLQVGSFTLAGVDETKRTVLVKGNAIPIVVPGSVNTGTVVAGGSGWVVGDLLTVAHGNGAILKVATVTAGALTTVSVVRPAGGAVATTADVATAIPPSVGIGGTITTTVNAGAGGLLIITGFSISASVVTFICANALTGGGGQVLVVQGFTGVYAYLNGTYTTTAATATQFTAAITAPNVPLTTNLFATATLQPTYTTGGIPVSWSFVDLKGFPRPVGGIGPLANPNWIEFQTIAGSALTYTSAILNSSSTLVGTPQPPPLVRIFTMAATAGEIASGAAITADVIGFKADFPFGEF